MSLQHAYNDFVANLRMFCNGPLTTCKKCEGKGKSYLEHPVKCVKCDGEGYEIIYEDGHQCRDACYRCGTTGETTVVDCDECENGQVQGPCGGWILSDFDTIHKCPQHFNGQPEPEL